MPEFINIGDGIRCRPDAIDWYRYIHRNGRDLPELVIGFNGTRHHVPQEIASRMKDVLDEYYMPVMKWSD